MADSIGSRIQNDFNDYIYKKIKGEQTAAPGGKPENLQQALADNKLTVEEYGLLKEKYLGENATEEDIRAFDTALQSTVGKSAESLKKADANPVELHFTKFEDGSVIVDDNKDLTDGVSAVINKSNAADIEVNRFKGGQYNYNSEFATKDFSATMAEVRKNNPEKVVGNKNNNAYLKPDNKEKAMELQKFLNVKDDGKIGAETMNEMIRQYNSAIKNGDFGKADKIIGYVKELGLDAILKDTPLAQKFAEIDKAGMEALVKQKSAQDAVTIAGLAVQETKNAMAESPPNVEKLTAIRTRIESSNLTDPVKKAILDKVSDIASDQLAKNMLPANKTLFGTDFVDSIKEHSSPKAVATEKVFNLLYDKKVENGKTEWSPKEPPDKEGMAAFMTTDDFKNLSPKVQAEVFRIASDGMDKSAKIQELFKLDEKSQSVVLSALPGKEAAKMLEGDGSIAAHKTADLLSAMPEDKAARILNSLSAQKSAEIKAIPKFSDNLPKIEKAQEELVVKGFEHLIKRPQVTSADLTAKLDENSSPKAKATGKAFELFFDKTEQDGKTTLTPKSPEKAALHDFIKTPDFSELSTQLKAEIFRNVVKGLSVHDQVKEIFKMDDKTAAEALSALDVNDAKNILTPPAGIAPHKTAELLKELPTERMEQIINTLPKEVAEQIRATAIYKNI